GRTYKGKLGPVAWRSADEVVRDGAILLDGMLRPDTQATAYVVAFALSPRDQDVAVRLGAPGPVKVWVDGALALSHAVVHAAALDQEAGAAHLRKGWNRILVKTTVTELPWRLYLRVTDRAGNALALGDGSLPQGQALPKAVTAARHARPPRGAPV